VQSVPLHLLACCGASRAPDQAALDRSTPPTEKSELACWREELAAGPWSSSWFASARSICRIEAAQRIEQQISRRSLEGRW